MKKTGSKILIEGLLKEGVELIFGYPGGAIMPIYDELYHHQDKIRHILVRHEQGATHAAEGYARITRKPGVCFATSGPGATNLITGLADALMDSVPMVCITGQVSSKFLGTDAFQETDVIGIAIPVTKWCCQVTKAEDIAATVKKAFAIARSGRPGPVLIDITKDAQFQSCEESEVCLDEEKPSTSFPSQEELEKAAALINSTDKVMTFFGNGAILAGAFEEAITFVERSGSPFASTLHGLCTISSTHPLSVGMLGMHGNYAPNVLTNEAELIVAIGMRFDDRVTGDITRYAKQAKIVHIEIDPKEINKVVKADVALCGDAKRILQALIPLVRPVERSEWISKFSSLLKREKNSVIERDTARTEGPLSMGEAIASLSKNASPEAIIVADVGQHQMSTARYFGFKQGQSWISSGGLGTMGFALPAAMGASIAAPNRQVIAIAGDGGFQMTLQELGTIAQENLPVKIVVMNNNFLGMVRQWQELFFESRYSFVEMSNPDFVKLSSAYGIPGWKVEKRDELDKTIKHFLAQPGPALLEICVEKEQNVFPMVPTGAAVHEILLGDEK